MTSDFGQGSWWEAPSAHPVEGNAMGGVVEVGFGAGRQPPAHVAGPAQGAQIPSPARHHEWRLPSVPSSVAMLRRGLRAFLDDAGRSHEEREDLVLATCEAVTNAVEHAEHPTEPFFDVTSRIVEDGVTIVVTDHGQWRPPTPSAYRGRGLAMMRLLADTTVEPGPDGTTVTLRTHRGVAIDLAQHDGRAS
jgi:anti-sigma regulatory factor (Ser/Thr protein kinase)